METEKLELNAAELTSHELANIQALTGVHPVVKSRSPMNEIEPVIQTSRVSATMPDTTPLSFGQRRIWFLDQLDPGSPLHHLSHLIRLRGRLDAEALKASLSSLIERHETLRTTYARHGADPVQTVVRIWTFHLERTDLSELDRETQERELARLAREDATKPFDLRSDLLLRARLVRLGDAEHALVLVLHHIAADDASMAVLYRELGALYEAYSAGGISLLPDLPFRYAGHACRQRDQLHGETLQRLVSFWREYLADAPPLLQLPSDRQRPPAQSRRGAVCTTIFSAELLGRLHALSTAHNAPLFVTLLAAFKTLLHRYTGQEDIVVGTLEAGRSLPGMAGLIGHVVNTLVLRTRLNGDPTFIELLKRVRETMLKASAHQEIPFEKLVDELQPRRDLSYDALCQVIFSLHETSGAHLKIAGLETGVEPVHTGTARTDLNVWAVEETAGLRVCAEYSQDLFDAGTVERLLGHFRTLLEAVSENPDRPISRLSLLTSQESMRMLSDWNATDAEYPRDKCIHHLFEEQVARTPDAIALVFNDHELSYAALNELADGLAARLRARGAGGPDTLVALCAERSLEMVAGLLGILKAGAAYVPLDPAFPSERLAFMLEDSGATVLVTQRHLQALFPEKTTVVYLEDNAVENGSAHPVTGAPCRPESLAYLLYTSGSTGRPKGVMVSHQNVVNLFTGMDRVVGSEPGVWLAVTSISFDMSVPELFWTLTRGFKVVVLADQAGMKSSRTAGGAMPGEEMRSLDEQLARHGVTHFQCTPSFARLLTRMPVTLNAFRPLRRMIVGGEALSVDLANVLSQSIEGDLLDMYGPTETTVYSTAHTIAAGADTVEIGRPLANTQVYILDRNRQLLPAGVPGELFIGGDGLARGYWRRPELTAERFVEHPFSPGRRLYRTGDLARYKADGLIEYLGRADLQVKVRGHRIELGEIEAVLAQQTGVAGNVVVVRTDNPEDPRLAAYIVPAPDAAPDAAGLRNSLRSKLPAHLVPDYFIFLENLPLTPNGKIDRKALPPPVRNTALQAIELASLPGLEQAIAAIWKEILAVEHMNLDDNFFDFGGRSFQVVQVKTRLQESLGIELPVIKLFQYPTIRSLADFIGSQNDESDSLHDKIKERTQRRHNAMAGRRQKSEEATS
jgi:amino acid adenylation domain-containing protein